MANARKPHTQTEMAFPTHGRKRASARRPRRDERANVPHVTRPYHHARHPVHVTIRVVADVTPLRTRDLYRALREATITAMKRGRVRIVHMSIQRTHVHLIVEAKDRTMLSKGVWGFSVSAAKHVNRAIGERTGQRRRLGRVVADRYHAQPLTNPRAVRNTISYVLNNFRHHGEDRASFARTWKVDPFSSGVAFPDWKELEHSPWLYKWRPTYDPLLVFRPRTWLLAKGWSQHYPLISVYEVPGN